MTTTPKPTLARTGSVFLDAAGGEDTDRAPIWLMRQAGRYLPEYQALKQRYTFWDMCRSPELAAEVTLQPVRRFPVDAAVIFTDIMVPVPAMGVQVDFTPSPVIAEPVRTAAAVARLTVPEEDEIAPYLGEAIRLVSQTGGVPVIGHAGAPLTFAAYLVTGKKSADHVEFRAWLRENPTIAHTMLDKITETTIRHLTMQIKAGSGAIQLFDTWAGVQDERTYTTFGLPYVRRIFEALAGWGVPRFYLVVGGAHLYPQVATLPVEVLSVDWRTSIGRCRQLLPGKVIQGNLDPAILLTSPEVLIRAAHQVLRDGLGGAHIFNVGHGVLPETPPDNVARLVDAVHEFSRHSEVEDGR
jgi:uroporphyrinogen decarboxylase